MAADLSIQPSGPGGDLGLYVHIPFCEKKCRYCAFYSVPLRGHDVSAFLDAVVCELDLYAPSQPVETLYLGGGSPSAVPEALLIGFLRRLLDRIGPVAECTLEINPAQASERLFFRLREAGATRLSIGGQSFHPRELDFLGRIHCADDIGRTVRAAQAAGFENLGLDLIYALAGCSLKTWEYSLEKALALDVPHLSAYSLTYEAPSPLYTDLQCGRVRPVDEELDRDLYEAAIDTLTAAGFEQVEISNFARPGFACRHNLRYWENRPWLGLGPSAGSWYQGRRTTNAADLDAYLAAIRQETFAYAERHTPSPLEIACETAVLNLRKIAGIHRAVFEQQTGYDPLTLFADPIRHHAALGLLDADPEGVRLTRQGLFIADSVLCDFAAIDSGFG